MFRGLGIVLRASALALDRLAFDRRPGEKGIEADRGQCRFPAENVGRAVAGDEETVTLRGIVPLDRRRILKSDSSFRMTFPL